MNSIDLAVIIILVFFFTRGIFRGFVFELITIIGLIFGYIAAITFLSYLVSFFKLFVPDVPVSILNIVAFAIIFISVNIILKFSGIMITKTLRFAMLGGLNRLLGGLLGALKGLLLIIIAVYVLQLIPFSDSILKKAGKNESVIYPYLEMLVPEIYKQYENFKKDGDLPI